MTDQKIKEAYTAAVQKDIYLVNYHSFKTGYMALLNELDPVYQFDMSIPPLYHLPEGVTKS